MIPKTIHYCWFGGNPKPKLAEKCIKSWKKYCPDYELVEWNENTFDIKSSPLYVRQAYEAKKWAFVTDYVRLYAMVNFGGIYMDTDVEVIKPLDKYLSHKAFSGFEAPDGVPTGIMACEKGHPFFTRLLNDYNNRSFINDDGSLNTITNVVYITDSLTADGLVLNDTLQTVDDFTLYPMVVFCPNRLAMNPYKSDETYTIHHFAGSWLSEKEVADRKDDISRLKKYYRKKKFRQNYKELKHKLKMFITHS